MEVTAVTLDGKRIRLEPMTREHLDGLIEAGAFAELWKWTNTRADSPEGMTQYARAAMEDRDRGTSLPFVTVDKDTGRVIGSSRFGNIDPPNTKTEIGWTWVTPAFQRTHVNSEAKLLMLTHAFEVWGCTRVELKTDVLNDKSRNAMKRFGAVEEGVLRKHILTYSGRYRDSIYYSVLDTEWPAVKERLNGFIARKDSVPR
ncbi:MAG: GNAT family protein [Gemmatimonadaceae bacterium]